MGDEDVVDVVWTADRKGRAEIVRREDGLFQIFLYREVPGDSAWDPPVYWSPVGQEAILTDTIERSRALAEEELRNMGGGEPA